MNPTRNKYILRLTLVTAVGAWALTLLVGCGNRTNQKASETTSATTIGAPQLTVDQAWARSSPAMANAGAVYMTLKSATADRLIRASVEPSVAARAELHETVTAGGQSATTNPAGATDDGQHMSPGGMNQGAQALTMKPVSAIDLPAGQSVSLQPGGLHVMLVGRTKPLASGSSFKLTLSFDKAGERVVDVPVRDNAPQP